MKHLVTLVMIALVASLTIDAQRLPPLGMPVNSFNYYHGRPVATVVAPVQPYRIPMAPVRPAVHRPPVYWVPNVPRRPMAPVAPLVNGTTSVVGAASNSTARPLTTPLNSTVTTNTTLVSHNATLFNSTTNNLPTVLLNTTATTSTTTTTPTLVTTLAPSLASSPTAVGPEAAASAENEVAPTSVGPNV